MDLPRHIYPLDRTARLSGSHGAAGPQRSRHGVSHVGIGEHEHRILAAELHRDLLLARHAGPRDHPPDRRRSREQHLGHCRLGERDPDVGAAVNDSHQPLGQAGADDHATCPATRQAGPGGGLEDHPVTSQQSPGDLAEGLCERRAARAYDAHHAIRLVCDAPTLGRCRQAAALDAAGGQGRRSLLRDPDQRVDRRQELQGGDLRSGAPLLAGERLLQLVEVVDHRLGHPAHVPRTVLEAQERPERLHLVHVPDDRVDPLRRRGVDAAEDLARRGIAREQSLRGGGLAQCGAHMGADYPPSPPRPRPRRIRSSLSASSASASSGR